MKYEIKNRFTQQVQFTAEIECDESTSWSVKQGLAVKVAFKSGANLRGADLRGAYLGGANLRDADLREGDLSRADLGEADLGEADLSGANLRGAHLSNADLSGANLRGAHLSNANLSNADLRGAHLSNANLSNANLRGANLSGANLRGADLRGAYLCNANLRGLILLARATRSDGHEYFAWSSILGGMVIKAGCRTWIGEDAIKQARWHCQTTTAERYRAEALRIVDFVEASLVSLRRAAA
jgi:uncharacterized protein YjbI with pentapeptide repeats